MLCSNPRIAAIHDLSGFGRTSLMVVIPIFSTMGIQVCPLPTAVLSSHTSGFDDFCFVDLSEAMRDFLAHWQKLGLRFDAVYSGFLGSPAQVDTVAECINTCLTEPGLVVVDPVLGDNGQLDPTMSMEMVGRLHWLTSKATCITPNLTEASLLLGVPYPLRHEKDRIASSQVREWLLALAEKGPEYVVITSVPLAEESKKHSVVAYERSAKRFWKVNYELLPAFYPGTGDTFASVLTGCLLQGDSLPFAMDRATQFVSLAIRAAFGYAKPYREGTALERVLPSLNAPVVTAGYTVWDE